MEKDVLTFGRDKKRTIFAVRKNRIEKYKNK